MFWSLLCTTRRCSSGANRQISCFSQQNHKNSWSKPVYTTQNPHSRLQTLLTHHYTSTSHSNHNSNNLTSTAAVRLIKYHVFSWEKTHKYPVHTTTNDQSCPQALLTQHYTSMLCFHRESTELTRTAIMQTTKHCDFLQKVHKKDDTRFRAPQQMLTTK